MSKKAYLAMSDEDFARLNQKRGEVEKWEDGVRTSGKFGEYEWWYFDGKMDDGSSLVVIYFTAPVTASTRGFKPTIIFSYTPAGGSLISESKNYDKKDAYFGKEQCDVRIGKNYCRGDLNTYEIHYEGDAVSVDATLVSSTQPWRPHTGRINFKKDKYFAWLPSVPEGKITATVKVGDKVYNLTGTGYHDHNWGNAGMFWLMHHWYWGRAKVGPYQVISSYITAGEKYGYEHFPIFVIYKDGEKLGCDLNAITYEQKDKTFDPITKKHYHKTLIYDYNDGAHHFRITYSAEKIIETFVVEEGYGSARAKASKALIWFVKKMKLSPSYIRVVGTVTLERFDGGEVVEKLSENGIWEQMYFGLDADV